MVREPQLRNQTSVWRFWVTLCLVTANLVLAGCAGWMPASVGFPTGDGLANLAEPRGIDWSTHRIGMRGLGDRQQAFVEAQAARLALNPPPPAPVAAPNSLYELQANWPASTTDWDYAGAKGIPVASLAVGADDVPNGLATAIAADSGKRIYALSRNGNFIKTNVTTPKVSNDSIPLNDTFTNSAITLSPAGKRAYVVSDSGTLYVIQTDNFGATVQSMNLPDSATAKGLAPILDPGSSSHDDMFDTLFVPANNGKVYRYEYSGSSLTYKQTYDLASSATPLTGCTGCTEYTGLKFAAPGIAYRGRILIGDTEGYFHDYHATTGVHRKYRLSITAPIVSAPAVEIYLDGKTYTDTATGNSAAQSGAQNQLREADALHAFVSVTRDVGPVCAWVNLAERSVLFSPPLFVDDTAGGNAALWGELDSYGYTYAAGQNNVLASISLGVSANGDAVALAIEGTNIPSTSNATQVTPLGAAKSGSGSTVHSFFKFDTDQIATTGAVFDEAYVYLTTTSGSPTDSDTPAPWLYRAGGWGESGGTGDRWRGSATIWTSNSGNSLTSSNYPWVVSAETASPAMVENSATNIAVTVSSSIRWLVNSVLPAPFRVGSVGLALALQPGDNIPWNNSKAPQFQGRSDSAPPYLRVQYDVVQDRPAYAPETSPLVDATRQRVFVYNSNYLFALSYASPDSWLGNSSASLIQPTYQVAFLGRPGQTGARDSGGNYVRNRTTPVPAFDFSSIYLLSHGPNGGNFDLAMSKITPNTNSANAALGDQERAKDTQNVVASTTLSTTATGTLLVNSSPVATSTASRYMLIDPFSNLSSKGGELLFGLSGTSRVYRIGTD